MPQFIMVSLLMIGLGINLALHGKPRKNPNYDGGVAVVAAIIDLTLLYWGGFFNGH